MKPSFLSDDLDDLNQAIRQLSLDSLQSDSPLALKVTSGSMSPVLKPGDIVSIQPINPTDLHIGDIIAFNHGDALITHRIVDRVAGQWRTKGDRNAYLDPPDDRLLILGRIISRRRKAASGHEKTASFTSPRFLLAHRLIARFSRFESRFYDTLSHQAVSPAWKQKQAWLGWRFVRLSLRVLLVLEA